MRNFLSVVYIKTNSIAEEKLSIGLFMGSEEELFFDFSESKLKLISDILPRELINSIKADLKKLKKEIELSNSKTSKDLIISNKLFSFSYFNYLSVYSDGLITFSKPEPIPYLIDKDKFNNLFLKYTGDKRIAPRHRNIEFSRVLSSYLKKETFTNRTDKNYEIKNNIIPTIIKSSKVDFISCNGSVYAGKAIDLNSEIETIKNHVNDFWVLSEGLKTFSNSHFTGIGNYDLYINEPITKEHKKVVDVLKKKNSNAPFSVKDIDALEQTEAKLEKDNYIRFSEKITRINLNI